MSQNMVQRRADFKEIKGVGLGVRIVLWLFLLTEIFLLILVLIHENDILVMTKGYKPSIGVTLYDLIRGYTTLAQLFLGVIGIVLFLVWVYRANSNLKIWNKTDQHFSSGWAVGWFFIPFTQWIMPCMVLHEIGKLSLYNINNLSTYVNKGSINLNTAIYWWIIFWLTNIVLFISRLSLSNAETASQIQRALFIEAGAHFLNLIWQYIAKLWIEYVGQAQYSRKKLALS